MTWVTRGDTVLRVANDENEVRAERVAFVGALGLRVRFVDDLIEHLVHLPRAGLLFVDRKWADSLDETDRRELYDRMVQRLERAILDGNDVPVLNVHRELDPRS